VIETRNLYRSEEAVNFILPARRTVVVKKKRKTLRFLALVLLALAVIVPAYIIAGTTATSFQDDHLFSIRKINIYGLDGKSSQTVKDALSSLTGKSLWALSAQDVEKTISGFGFVEGFLLKKQYPSEVTIEIKQRDAVGVVDCSSRVYQLDGRGNFWELENYTGQKPEVKGPCDLSEKAVQKLIKDITAENLAGTIVSIEPADPKSFILTTKEGREIIVFGDDFNAEWQKYIQTWDWIKRNIRIESRVDLRWSNRVVLVPLNGPQEEVKEDGKA
jgi:cell division septal protein FtsQ